jgi:hypothetical protein
MIFRNKEYSVRRFSVVLLLILILVAVLGCSNADDGGAIPENSPVHPSVNSDSAAGRILWGAWEISFDPAQMEIDIVPLRNVEAHQKITFMLLPPQCNNCIEIDINSFNPTTRILDLDVTLRNKFSISGYDVRGIVYEDNKGFKLTNADDWTPWWDIPGGIEINPFKAFAKELGQRLFIAGASHTENFKIYVPEPEVPGNIVYAVDASYPGHCEDPYSIDNFEQLEILSDLAGLSAMVQVDVHDWQENLQSVRIGVPELTGEEYTSFTYKEGDTWELEIQNNTGAAPGEYKARLVAISENSGGIGLHDWVTVTVTAKLLDEPVDITPPSLNFSPRDICVSGNYAYVAGGFNGLHIFDVSDPLAPVWVSRLESPEEVYSVDVEGDVAYVTILNQGLVIVDVCEPYSPSILYGVYNLDKALDVVVDGEYAYVADGNDGLKVIDISPPESAAVVHTVEGVNIRCVAMGDGYLYATEGNANVVLINISSPLSASVINTVAIPKGTVECIDVGNDLVAVTSNVYEWPWCFLYLIDVSDPASAAVVKTVNTVHATGVRISGDYAYVSSYYGMHVVDITPVASASIVTTVELFWQITNLDVAGDYAYVIDSVNGIEIVDISNPEEALLAASVLTPVESLSVTVSDGLAYVGGFRSDLMIVDIDPVETASVVGSYPSLWIYETVLSGELAYIANVDTGLQIVDVVPPDAASLVKDMDLQVGRGVYVAGDYAYLTTWSNGISIIDISDPAEASIIKDIDLEGEKWAIEVVGEMAYVANGNDGLSIIDIDPPEEASIVKTVATPDSAVDVAIANGYAYVPCSEDGLLIIDIDPVDQAGVIKTVDIPGYARKIALADSYACVASNHGMYVVTIAPVASAHIFASYNDYLDIRDVYISDDIAYLAHYGGGLRIIQLK